MTEGYEIGYRLGSLKVVTKMLLNTDCSIDILSMASVFTVEEVEDIKKIIERIESKEDIEELQKYFKFSLRELEAIEDCVKGCSLYT